MVDMKPTMAPPSPAEETLPIGLEGPFVERQHLQPSPSIIDRFLRIEPVPESAWLSAGMPLEVAALHRRVRMNWFYMLLGMVDIDGDVMTSMAAWAGHDRKAREEAKDVAIGIGKRREPNEQEQMRQTQAQISSGTPNPG